MFSHHDRRRGWGSRELRKTGKANRKVGFGIGAGDRIRTGDINLGKVALYQLSYSRSL